MNFAPGLWPLPAHADQAAHDEGLTRSERVRLHLKGLVTSGAFRPGERLDPKRLKEETDASLSTVYSALRALTLEHLVEAGPHESFHLPAVSEAQLRGHYRFITSVAIRAVADAPPAIGPSSSPFRTPPDDMLQRTEALFDVIAAMSEIFDYGHTMHRAHDRIRAARRLEPMVLPELSAELEQIAAAIDDRPALVRLLIDYRDRRLAVVADLIRLRLHGRM